MEQNIQCNIYEINLTTQEEEELKNHSDTQHKVICQLCPTCHLIFNSDEELLQNIGKEHKINHDVISVTSMNTNSNYTCTLGGVCFPLFSTLYRAYWHDHFLIPSLFDLKVDARCLYLSPLLVRNRVKQPNCLNSIQLGGGGL